MWLAINFLRTASVILISLIIYRERIIAVDQIENNFTHFARFILAFASAVYLRTQMRISAPFPVYRFHLVLPHSIVLHVDIDRSMISRYLSRRYVSKQVYLSSLARVVSNIHVTSLDIYTCFFIQLTHGNVLYSKWKKRNRTSALYIVSFLRPNFC